MRSVNAMHTVTVQTWSDKKIEGIRTVYVLKSSYYRLLFPSKLFLLQIYRLKMYAFRSTLCFIVRS